jgi:hypothetical protein
LLTKLIERRHLSHVGSSHEAAATAAQVVEDKTYEADRLIRRARPSP